MKILISDLQKINESILSKIKEIGVQEIDVDVDYYWDIDDPYDLKAESPKAIVGSFIDDWQSLKKILDDKVDPSIIDFDRLGNVIKIIGDSIQKLKKVY